MSFFSLKISQAFLTEKSKSFWVFLNPAMAGAISFTFIAKFQLHILCTWLIHRWRALKFECLSKYKAGQSLKMVAEANNLNLLKKIQKSQTVSGLKIYDPLENYFFF